GIGEQQRRAGQKPDGPYHGRWCRWNHSWFSGSHADGEPAEWHLCTEVPQRHQQGEKFPARLRLSRPGRTRKLGAGNSRKRIRRELEKFAAEARSMEDDVPWFRRMFAEPSELCRD